MPDGYEIANPWLTLPTSSPFVLDADREQLESFNSALPVAQRFHLELLPEPFLGAITSAPVVFLYMNPAYSETEIEYHRNPAFRETAVRNLRHESLSYPFYFLDPTVDPSPGHGYWRSAMDAFVRECGLERVANNVAILEWYPYHALGMSRSGRGPRLESQRYSFALLRAAIARGAVIVLVRAVRWWEDAVRELSSAHNVYVVKEKYRQGGRVTPASCPDGYEAVKMALLA